MVIFHGGCHGCIMQEKEGLGYCVGCQFFDGEWSKPNLNDKHIREHKKMEGIRKEARRLAYLRKQDQYDQNKDT